MKIQLTKRDLESAISTASACVITGPDIFAHFVFRIEDNDFQVLASNGRSGVVVPIVTTSIDGEGSFAVEGWRIKQWLSGVDNSVITFEMDGKTLKTKSDRGVLSFRCMDTKDFPFWDAAWAQVTDSKGIDSSLLIRALNHVKGFVAPDRDTDAPELSVCEIHDDILGATNTTVMATVKADVFDGLQLRIHGKDLPPLLKFLGTTKNDSVKVYSSDSELFVERNDGAVFVVSRPPHEMVKRPISADVNFAVTFNREIFKSTMTALLSTSDKDTERMSVSFGETELTLSVESDAGTNSMKVDTTVSIPCDDLPESIDFTPALLLKAMDKVEGDETSLEIILMRRDGVLKGGLFRVKEEEDNATFSVVLIWKA